MKFLIASDIHGSAYYCEQLLQAFEREQAARLLLLGDILYHGPRNDLPRDYAPKKVIAMLNGMADTILCVRGNCDTEVDQMVLAFPILADYAVLPAGERLVYVTHGHHLQYPDTAAAASGRCAAARTYAYSGMGAVWQGKPVSEPGFSVHPEK